jgi:hypothetical protein
MIFKEFIKNINSPFQLNNADPKNISVYPISIDNLEGIKILIDNCMRMGSENNNNVTIATLSPTIWLGEFLDKYWQNISYVTTLPKFDMFKIEDNKIISKSYSVLTSEFSSDDEIDRFFIEGRWKKFVLYSIIKYANLEDLSTSYRIRFADITEKYEERENKLQEILK